MIEATLARVIGAIGAPEFPAVAAESLRALAGFELAAVVLHREERASLMFDNFDAVGGRDGLAAYVAVTRRANPMLARARGAVRASDFAGGRPLLADQLRDYLEPAEDEELGFRTKGWPPRTEEIGLYFPGCGGLVEVGLYRERAQSRAPAATLAALDGLAAPLAAAFDRHEVLAPRRSADREVPLSARERQVYELLLIGCSTDAIALRLGIGRYTVKDHRKRIFRKLGVGSLQELFARAR